MALLARRWGCDPEHLRETLTEDQFGMYLEIEGSERASEWAVDAYGTLAAIAESFGSKGAVRKFVQAIKPKKSGTDSTSELRRRMGKLVAMGLVREEKS